VSTKLALWSQGFTERTSWRFYAHNFTTTVFTKKITLFSTGYTFFGKKYIQEKIKVTHKNKFYFYLAFFYYIVRKGQNKLADFPIFVIILNK
jgi:hypothetical protein